MKLRLSFKEVLFYALGAVLIFGFVTLYSARFLFIEAMAPAMMRLFFGAGRGWAVLINAAVFILFLIFLPYRRGIAWRSKGAFAAFILALMAEMFGIPLLLYILSPALSALIADRTQRLSAYTWLAQLGSGSRSSIGLILGAWITLIGMLLVIAGWKQIHRASGLVRTGIYRWVRHPQYTGLFLILTGWVIHWPTLLTLIMYPILLFAYYRLSRKEEQEMLAEFGEAYLDFHRTTAMFFPNPFKHAARSVRHGG